MKVAHFTVLIAAGVLATSQASLAEERFALIIGANAGWANDRPLRYAESDAGRVRDVLVELGGFSEERVQTLRDPDTAQVREALGLLAGVLRGLSGQESMVVLYYSGHADEQHLHLRGPPLSYVELYEALRDLPATVRVGVLDACRSGSILPTKGGRQAAAFQVKVVNELGVRGLALLTSSGADELSQETRELAGSVFTHHLVSALRGAGDADGDGTVSLSEAWRHAFQRTEAATAATASPHHPAFRLELVGHGELVLTRPLQGASRLLLPRGNGERYVVVDEQQVRLVAEGLTRLEEQVALVLAPGTYHVMHVRQESLAVATILLEAGTRAEAATLAYASRPLSVGLLKGRPEELEGEELREWHRGEALRLLEAGDARAALRLFEELLAAQPDDAGALRGRARALVRLADQHALNQEPHLERKALRLALEAEPSLSGDPDFANRYRRLQQQEAVEAKAAQLRLFTQAEARQNRHLLKRWGIGIGVLSLQGFLTLWGAKVLSEEWFLHLALDPLALGGDLTLRHVPGSMITPGLSPTFGAGVHLSLSETNLLLWGNAFHIEAGFQYLTTTGYAINVGLGLSLFRDHPTGDLNLLPMPVINTGWFF
jgi:hypothetical protein